MNRLIVNPMPQSIATPKSEAQVAPSGSRPMPSRMDAHANPNTPTVLPTNSPAAMPRGTGANADARVTPSRDTPALANTAASWPAPLGIGSMSIACASQALESLATQDGSIVAGAV